MVVVHALNDLVGEVTRHSMVMVSMITWFTMIVMGQLSGVSGLTCVRQMTLITGP